MYSSNMIIKLIYVFIHINKFKIRYVLCIALLRIEVSCNSHMKAGRCTQARHKQTDWRTERHRQRQTGNKTEPTSNLAQSQLVLQCVGRCKWPNWISYVAFIERTSNGNSTFRNFRFSCQSTCHKQHLLLVTIYIHYFIPYLASKILHASALFSGKAARKFSLNKALSARQIKSSQRLKFYKLIRNVIAGAI